MALVKTTVSEPDYPKAVTPVTPSPGIAEPPMVHGKPLSKYELEKDRRIHVSGIMQAVASSSVLAPFVMKQEDFAKVVIEESRKLLKAAQEFVEKGW